MKTIMKRTIRKVQRVIRRGTDSGQPVRSTNDMYQAIPRWHRVQQRSLLHWYGNVYSQRGQDGILAEILRRLAMSRGSFVEFGAWDGAYLANCRLLAESGWGGVFIEGDRDRYGDLVKNCSALSDVKCINAFVTTSNLASLLAGVSTQRIDVASIDVDGADLEIATGNRLLDLGVAVVILEGGSNFSPLLHDRVPSELALQQPLAVIIDEMGNAGYEPVCFFQDLYLVRKDLSGPFVEIDRRAETLFQDAVDFMGDEIRDFITELRSRIGASTFERAGGVEPL
jgi:hypothetical protein